MPKGDSDMVEEVKIFHNVLDLSDTRVRDCMIPRTEINCDRYLRLAQTKELMQRFTESGHSKIIVYKENIDNIIGYIHSSENVSSRKKLENKNSWDAFCTWNNGS